MSEFGFSCEFILSKNIYIILKITFKYFDLITAKTKLKKDFNFQLHHRLSKFEVPVVVNLKHTFELFSALYHLVLDLETIGVN